MSIVDAAIAAAGAARYHFCDNETEKRDPLPIPAGAMRVAPGTDAIVWRICPEHSGEL